MNVGALPDLILNWFKNQGTDLLQANPDQQPSQGQFNPGQQYDGQVLENLPNGRSLVQVADQKLDMALPQQLKAGDVVRLTYVQPGPRPTFVLSTSAAPTPQQVTVSQAAQQVNALSRYATMVNAESTAAPQVAVQQVQVAATQTSLVMQGQPSATPGRPSALPGQPPATPGQAKAPVGQPASAGSASSSAAANPATASTTAAATASAQAAARPIVANPATMLAATPVNVASAAVAQGPVLSTAMMTDEAVNGAYSSTAANQGMGGAQGVAGQQQSANHLLPVRLQQTVKESGLFYESHLGKWARGEISLDTVMREPQAKLAQAPGQLLNMPGLEGMPARAADLASRQLNMLEGNPFIWQGQVWPGQDMEWQVTEREGGGNPFEAEAQKWHSKLRLTLPRLGAFAAELDVGALGLRIRLTSQSPEALAEMKAALPDLVQRMQSADLNLTSLKTGLADGNNT